MMNLENNLELNNNLQKYFMILFIQRTKASKSKQYSV